MKRRTFIKASSIGAAGISLGGGLMAAKSPSHIRLGIDSYTIRDLDYNAMQLVDYAHQVKTDALQVGIYEFENLEPDHLKKVKAHADVQGIHLELAMASICPKSVSYNSERRPDVRAYMLQGINVARELETGVIKVFLGNWRDRHNPPSIPKKMEATIEALRSVKNEALDAGVRFALETHGDLLAREVLTIIEEAGPDISGCCLDSGNPVRLGEDPIFTLEVLGKHVLTTHIRDSVVYEHPRGAAYQWVALGEGTVDFTKFVDIYRKVCPGAPFQLEILTGRPPQVIPYLEKDYWKAFPNMPAKDFARFLQLVRRGQPYSGGMMIATGDELPPVYKKALVEQQRYDLERSIKYAQNTLDLGINWR